MSDKPAFVDPVRALLSEKYFPCSDAKNIERIWSAFEGITSRPHPQAGPLTAAYQHHYGQFMPAGLPWAATRRGDEGELTGLTVNSSSPLVKAKVALVCASQVSWAVRAKQDAAASTYATSLSKSLMESAWKDGGLAVADIQMEETSQVLTACYAFLEWDRTRGPVTYVDAESGVRRHEGDCRLNLLSPLMVATDPNLDSADDQDWWFLCLDRPKADLVHLYQKLADGRTGQRAAEAIMGVSDRRLQGTAYRDIDALQTLANVVHFIHRPSLALPLGRHVVMLSGDVILRDTPLVGKYGDYECVPVVRRASEEQIGTPFGYSRYLDTLGPQDILDGHWTTQASIMSTFGNPVFAYQDGTTFEQSDLEVFGRPVKIPPGGEHPGYITPPDLNETHMKAGELLVQRQQQSLSLNDAALGQPQTAERNAQAEALFASMAVQQAGPAVLARRRSLTQIGQVWLTTLRKNVTGRRLLKKLGAGQANLLADMKDWTGSDLLPVDAVEVEETSPLESTIQGRWAIYENYLKLGLIKTQADAEQVRNTGRLNRVVDPIRDRETLMQVQYEMLSSGKMPLVHPVANGPDFYKSNASVLLSTHCMADRNIRTAVEKTLALRYNMYFGLPLGADPHADPQYADRERFLLGEGPLPMPMPMPPPAAGAPSDVGGASPAGPDQPMPAPDAGTAPINGPINKLTGQPFSPTQPPIQ